MNLIEYIAKIENTDIDSAKELFNATIKRIIDEPFHYGDCTNENISCNLCYFEELLNNFYKFTKKQLNGKNVIQKG